MGLLQEVKKMARNGNYPIWIFAGKNGKLYIGADSCKNSDCCERVYGSQIPHRVVVYNKKYKMHWLMTPTNALKDKNCKITDWGHSMGKIKNGRR